MGAGSLYWMLRSGGTVGTHQTSHSVKESQRMLWEPSRSQMLWAFLLSDWGSFCGAAEHVEHQTLNKQSHQSGSYFISNWQACVRVHITQTSHCRVPVLLQWICLSKKHPIFLQPDGFAITQPFFFLLYRMVESKWWGPDLQESILQNPDLELLTGEHHAAQLVQKTCWICAAYDAQIEPSLPSNWRPHWRN